MLRRLTRRRNTIDDDDDDHGDREDAEKGDEEMERYDVFFPFETFLPQDLGLGLLYWAISRQRNDCVTGQSPG